MLVQEHILGGHFQGADKESYQTHQASQYGMRRGDMAGQGRQQCRAFALPVAAPLLPCGQSSRDSQHRRFLFPLKFHFQWLQPEQDKPTAACLRVRIKNRYSCSHPHSVLKAQMCFYVILTEWFCIYNTYVHNTDGVSRMSIDYKDIGQRIKRLRMEKGLTQERLSEIIGVGPSHMSHIESGSTVPSLEVFISILNALDCSADELLCRETNAGKPLLNSWLSEIIADCDPTETKILSDIVISAKETLRRNKISE